MAYAGENMSGVALDLHAAAPAVALLAAPEFPVEEGLVDFQSGRHAGEEGDQSFAVGFSGCEVAQHKRSIVQDTGRCGPKTRARLQLDFGFSPDSAAFLKSLTVNVSRARARALNRRVRGEKPQSSRRSSNTATYDRGSPFPRKSAGCGFFGSQGVSKTFTMKQYLSLSSGSSAASCAASPRTLAMKFPA